MYDFIVVGAGIFGSTFAYEAKRKGKKVLVIDKRNHIGGNCFSEKRNNIDVHLYGPHIFHTSDKKIWNFINQFSEFNNFVFRPKVSFDEKIYSFPINMMTLHQVWGVKTPEEAQEKLKSQRIACDRPRNLEEWILSQIGKELYELFIRGYTVKQWMRDPKDLPASIIKRLPIRLTYDDNYFNDSYQGIPLDGYTRIFENMLEGVDLGLGEDFFQKRTKWEKLAKKIVYTGKIDEFYDFSKGELEYRSLRFEHEETSGDFQGNAVINYTHEKIPYTRITEHKHFLPSNLDKTANTIYTKEFPIKWDRSETPYYPIGDEKNNSVYQEYKQISDKENNVIFGGRLADYKYFDMHQVIGSALMKCNKLLGA